MTPGQASKLRGLLQWLDTGLTGRPCRGALAALVARQYWERPTGHRLTQKLDLALRYIQEVAHTMPARSIPLGGPEADPVVVYSDAATLSSGLRVGILILEKAQQALCSVYDVPSEVVDAWELRSTYIGQGELLAGPLALTIAPRKFEHRDVYWFIDNVSACSALIKGSSPKEDSSALALVAGLLAARLGCRVWVEYVHTSQNPADRLSRGGYKDPVVQERVHSGIWVPVQPEIDWRSITNQDFTAAHSILRRWGTAGAGPCYSAVSALG